MEVETMSNGEIAEIRRIRHRMSAEFGHDVHKLAAYYRQVGEELEKSGRFRFARESLRNTETGSSLESPGTTTPGNPPDSG